MRGNVQRSMKSYSGHTPLEWTVSTPAGKLIGLVSETLSGRYAPFGDQVGQMADPSAADPWVAVKRLRDWSLT